MKRAVYPRVGGATPTSRRLAPGLPGLSPRGRGNLTRDYDSAYYYRSIPAWAGQPDVLCVQLYARGVYPRVGGATARSVEPSQVDIGLSPRGRGNRHGLPHNRVHDGSIPAWAGQPRITTSPCLSPRVYPRVGGATGPLYSNHRGTSGLSPRGRGNRAAILARKGPIGSIPAWAGQPMAPREEP